MLSTSIVLLVGALFCLLMLLVLLSMRRSQVPGIREWCAANALGAGALTLYAYGRELPPLLAVELASALYALATAAAVAGYRRFLGSSAGWPVLIGATAATVAVIAFFHHSVDSFAGRAAAMAVYQTGISAAIIVAVLRARRAWRSRFPYYFTAAMAGMITLGHGARVLIYVLLRSDAISSLLQPTGWNLFFVAAGTFVLPVLSIGALMMVHDAMVARAEHAANHDFLTGACSRRAFFEAAERELARARRRGAALSLLMLDIDHFKQINDNWGHAAGDQVLTEVVAVAAAAIREVDYLGRVGGEEFAVLLPETDAAAAVLVAERLRLSLDRDIGVTAGGERASVVCTVSIGAASMAPDENWQGLMRRADDALYAAKRAGRNQVVLAPPVTGCARTAGSPDPLRTS